MLSLMYSDINGCKGKLCWHAHNKFFFPKLLCSILQFGARSWDFEDGFINFDF